MLHQRPKTLFSDTIEADRGDDDDTDTDTDTDLDPLMIDNNTDTDTDKDTAAETEIHVNDAKLGALLYFPLIGMALTSCIGDMYHRNSTLHREPNTARALLVDCPVQDPDRVWLVLVCCYLVMMGSIGVLCHAMLGGLDFDFGRILMGKGTKARGPRGDAATVVSDGAEAGGVGTGITAMATARATATARSKRMRVTTCRICLVLIYVGMYHYNVCMGSMPYLKKKTAQVYLTCIILFVSSETLAMPLVVQTFKSESTFKSKSKSKSSTPLPPRWPLFLLKIMVFIPYANAGWYKVQSGFNGDSLRTALMGHYIYFERPIAMALMKYPLVTSASAWATLLFECGGWMLVVFGYDRLAAGIAFKFHLGIYLAMRINYLLFWGCSFVFFFVPSIASSNLFRRLVVKRLLLLPVVGETRKPMPMLVTSVPLGCSLLTTVGIENNDENHKDKVDDGGSNEKPKRSSGRNCLTSATGLAIFWALALTYKGFRPPNMMFPPLPQSIRGSFLSGLYNTASEMAAKPFNSYTMFAGLFYPTQRTEPILVLKRLASTSQDTDAQNDAQNENYRRVKWIPRKPADEYFLTNMLGSLNMYNKDDTYALPSASINNNNNNINNNSTFFENNVTQCHVFACLARHHLLGATRIDDGWDVHSIELTVERYYGTSGADVDSLRKKRIPLCAIDIDVDTNRSKIGVDVAGNEDSAWVDRYEDDSCGDILATLDASARAFNADADADASQGEENYTHTNANNPFYIEPVVPHREKQNGNFDIGMGWVVTAMLIVGYKTYLHTD